MRKYLFLMALLTLSIGLCAQDTPISDGGTITIVCGGPSVNLTDSGGPAANYAAGESYTMTFCPDGGNAIVFIIDTETVGHQFDLANGDLLTIFDGDDTSAPVLDILSSTSTLGSPVITLNATLDNPGGCLTFLFESTSASPTAGGWTSAINCGNFWQPFTLEMTTSPTMIDADNYIDICQGETVTFTATGIYPFSDGSGYNQTNDNSYFEWEMGDGTEFEGFGLTTLDNTYTEQFGYPVTLTVTDTLGQQQLFVAGVRVSTTPNFANVIAEYQAEVCLGNSTTLVGGIAMDTSQSFGVLPVPSAFIGGGFLAGQTFLPDGSGAEYETTIVIDDFPVGSTVENADDIVAICATMEHSFLGDLDITLTCPDGTTMILQNQEGESCNLGVPWATSPVDGESTVLTPGEGYQYCWTADAPNGTLASGCVGPMDFLVGDGPDTYQDTQVAPGDYTPAEPISDLIGCPINGEWTITVTDNIGADNGYIFSWGVQFNPLIDPTIETYQPVLVDGYWEDEPTIIIDNDTIIEVQPPMPGDYSYTFHVSDDFGCEYDTTVIVTVLEPLSISAMNPACDFESTIDVQNSTIGGSWFWLADNENIVSTTPDADGIVTNTSQVSGTVTYVYDDIYCEQTLVTEVFFTPYPVAELSLGDYIFQVDDTLELCLGDEVILQNVTQPSAITDPQYTWSINGGGLFGEAEDNLFISADFPNQTLAMQMNGNYQISVVNPACPDYAAISTLPLSTEGCQPYNVFTPNSDSENSTFYIGGVERLRNTQLWIYNRWGRIVYEAENYQNDWKMEDVSDGTYYYVLKSDSKKGEYKGSFTVLGSGR